MTEIFWIIIAAVGGIGGFWRPSWMAAIVIVVTPAYLLKTNIASIPSTALEAALVGLVVGWLVRTVVRADARENFRGAFNRLVRQPGLWIWPALALAGWSIATLISIDQRASLGALKAWLIEPMAFGLILLVELRRETVRDLIERALLVALLWVSVVGIVQVIGFPATLEDRRLSSVFAPVANYFAMFAAPLMVYAFGMAELGRQRSLAFVSLASGVLALVLSFSYGGLLAFAAGVTVVIIKLFPEPRRRRALLGLFATGVLLMVLLIPTRYFREKINFSTRSSSLVRTQIWRTAVEIGRAHPLFGIGPATFEQAYRTVAPTLYHPPLEWLVAKPHHLYLNLWVETGLLGLVGTLGLFFIVIRRGWQTGWMAVVAAASLVAILAHGFVDTPLFKNDLAVVASVFVSLALSGARTGEIKNQPPR